jgi:hypothetical protein
MTPIAYKEYFVGASIRRSAPAGYTADPGFVLRACERPITVDPLVLPLLGVDETPSRWTRIGVGIEGSQMGATVYVLESPQAVSAAALRAAAARSNATLIVMSILVPGAEPAICRWTDSGSQDVALGPLAESPIAGYDIASLGQLSALFNCGYTDEDRHEAEKSRWIHSLNQYGLLGTAEDAFECRAYQSRRTAEHGPFFVWGLRVLGV